MTSGRGFNGTSHIPFGRIEESTSSLAPPHSGREREPSLNQGVTLTNALTAAQELHAEAKKLPADVRAVYLQEIKDVGALFAYTDPETSILKGFLEQRRRIALAEQVNAAILSESCRVDALFWEESTAFQLFGEHERLSEAYVV